MLRLQTLLLLCALASAGRGAEIYRCTGNDGEPLYTQIPCDASTRVARPPEAGLGPATGIRASERAWLEARERAGRRDAGPTRRSRASGATAPAGPARHGYACREKQRALDAVQARLRRGYKPAQGERLRRRRASYEDYIAVFCRP
jgi:hypothetical protein